MTRPFDSGEREPQLKATREKTTAERTDDARRHFFQVWMVIGAAALIYMFGFVLDVLSLPVAIIVWTIVFVLVLRSPIDALERRGVRRGLGTTIAFAGMFAVLAALVVIMFSPIFGVNDQFGEHLLGATCVCSGAYRLGEFVLRQVRLASAGRHGARLD